jgi:hypothetical protein
MISSRRIFRCLQPGCTREVSGPGHRCRSCARRSRWDTYHREHRGIDPVAAKQEVVRLALAPDRSPAWFTQWETALAAWRNAA